MTDSHYPTNDDNSWKRISRWRYNHGRLASVLGQMARVIQHREQRIEDPKQCGFLREETIRVRTDKKDLYDCQVASTNPGYQSLRNACCLVLTTGVQTTISDIYLKAKKALMIQLRLYCKFGDRSQRSMRRFALFWAKVSRYPLYVIGMCAVLMVVVAIVTLLIYNSFSISLTERTRRFGLFKSIGAARFRVIVSVFLKRAFWQYQRFRQDC